MLIVVEERYVVVLEEREEQKVLEFITAFPADEYAILTNIIHQEWSGVSV